MYQKREISLKIKRGDLEKSKFSGLGGVLKTSYHSTMLQEIEVLPTLDYFQPWDCFKKVWLC